MKLLVVICFASVALFHIGHAQQQQQGFLGRTGDSLRSLASNFGLGSSPTPAIQYSPQASSPGFQFAPGVPGVPGAQYASTVPQYAASGAQYDATFPQYAASGVQYAPIRAVHTGTAGVAPMIKPVIDLGQSGEEVYVINGVQNIDLSGYVRPYSGYTQRSSFAQSAAPAYNYGSYQQTPSAYSAGYMQSPGASVYSSYSRQPAPTVRTYQHGTTQVYQHPTTPQVYQAQLVSSTPYGATGAPMYSALQGSNYATAYNTGVGAQYAHGYTANRYIGGNQNFGYNRGYVRQRPGLGSMFGLGGGGSTLLPLLLLAALAWFFLFRNN